MLLMIFIYLSVFLFFALSVKKAYQLAKMPFHGRWELYPVPGEKRQG